VTFETNHFKNGFAFASAMRRVAFAARTLIHFAELLQLCAKIAREKQLRITMHVAESAQEFENVRQARGGMFDWLKKNPARQFRLRPWTPC